MSVDNTKCQSDGRSSEIVNVASHYDPIFNQLVRWFGLMRRRLPPLAGMMMGPFAGGLFPTALGCGGSPETTPGENNLSVALTPAVIEVKGRPFLRRDLWTEETFAAILDQGRADQTASRDVLAAQLRAHLLHQGTYYVEIEPNFALADEILKGPAEPPRMAGTRSESAHVGVPLFPVIGTDDRVQQSALTIFPNKAISFDNSKGSRVKISPHTAYTAAHVAYDLSTGGWWCADAIHTNAMGSAPGCALPSWRFGVDGNNGVSGWLPAITCYDMSIPNGYVSLGPNNQDHWLAARWDYATVGLVTSAACNLGATGYLGTSNLPSPSAVSFSNGGYPEWAKCTNDQQGVNFFDCTGGSFQLTGGGADQRTGPFSGAHFWKQDKVPGVAVGMSQAAFTLSTQGDDTHGNSGGPLYYFNPDDGSHEVVGVAAYSANNQVDGFQTNIFQRWTSETYSFFIAQSPYPN